MDAVKDTSHLYEVERRVRHAERPGFRISELQISPAQQVPWHAHTLTHIIQLNLRQKASLQGT